MDRQKSQVRGTDLDIWTRQKQKLGRYVRTVAGEFMCVCMYANQIKSLLGVTTNVKT